jgi:hypothetical protein
MGYCSCYANELEALGVNNGLKITAVIKMIYGYEPELSTNEGNSS